MLFHFISASSTSCCSGLYSRIVLDPFCSNGFGSAFPSLWDRRIYESKFPTPVSFLFFFLFFLFSVSRIVLSFPTILKTILLSVTVAMLSCYKFPVNCRSRTVEGTSSHRVKYRYCCLFQAWNFCSYLKETSCILKDEEMGEFSE